MRKSLRACLVVSSLLLSQPGARAQSGAASVRLAGQVSGAVALSIPEALAQADGARVSIEGVDSATSAVSISGSGRDGGHVSLRLQLRTNVGYDLRASLQPADALDVRLSVGDIRATGKFVHPDALDRIKLGESLAASQGRTATSLSLQNQPSQVAILSGSPVSMAGTFASPDNAVEVVLNLEIQSKSAAESWSTRLIISASPCR